MPDRLLRRIAVAVLAWNLLVIGWGAFVRASGSGAGCGAHWPLCDGEIVPFQPSTGRLIEWTHRATSGLALVAGLVLVVVAFRRRHQGDPARRAAAASLAFLLVEAGLGAGLVLFELVDDDASAARALAIVLHLVNTFFLVGALALTLHFADDPRPLRRRADPAAARWATLALTALVLAGATGAIAALGDTLFPARSLLEGMRAELAPTAHFLLRLRLLHPTFAVAAAVAVALFASRVATSGRSRTAILRARWAASLALAQVTLGVVDVLLLAPIPLQIAHLLLADLVWIATVLTMAAALAQRPALPD